MKLRRGFIKESEELSLGFREELGIAISEPLCVHELCDLLCVRATKLSELPSDILELSASVIGHGTSETKFFATTLMPNGYPEILYNDFVSPQRQRSDIAHELAHIILGHEPHAVMGKNGCRNYDREMEREAHELGYTLLIPKPSALYAIERFHIRREAASHFEVSDSLLDYRIRKSNADGWAKQRAYKRRRENAL